jgi:phage baseplate assembly protein W
MAGVTPQLPLNVDSIDGHYKLIKSYKNTVRQNFKNLILTSPGERMMDPEFGVGIRNYLFENASAELTSQIEARIYEQVEIYLPFVEVTNVSFNLTSGEVFNNPNALNVTVSYYIIPLQFYDNLEITTPVY